MRQISQIKPLITGKGSLFHHPIKFANNPGISGLIENKNPFDCHIIEVLKIGHSYKTARDFLYWKAYVFHRSAYFYGNYIQLLFSFLD
jgi:hypothetical protein